MPTSKFVRQPGRTVTLLSGVITALVVGAAPAPGQEPAGSCFLLCTPSIAVEPTVTIENLFARHRVLDIESGDVARATRDVEFEIIFAVDVPTTIPRVGLTFEAIWTPFASTAANPFTGESASDIGKSEIRDNPVELEFELNLDVLDPKVTRGWLGAHFDVVDKFSPAERPGAGSTYTHKLNFELDVGVAAFKQVPHPWLRRVELEASLDYLASGIPRAGDEVPAGAERYLDDASPWSLSLVLILPVAPLR